MDFDRVVYDDRADVLYLSVGELGEPARQVATDDGHLVSYDSEGVPVGITLVNAKWLLERDERISVSIDVTANARDLAPALAGVAVTDEPKRPGWPPDPDESPFEVQPVDVSLIDPALLKSPFTVGPIEGKPFKRGSEEDLAIQRILGRREDKRRKRLWHRLGSRHA